MAGKDCALVAFDASSPLIVLTNDDGVGSPGLAALKTALEPLGEVRIVAPDQNRSGAARSITMQSPLWVEEVTLPDGSLAFSTVYLVHIPTSLRRSRVRQSWPFPQLWLKNIGYSL